MHELSYCGQHATFADVLKLKHQSFYVLELGEFPTSCRKRIFVYLCVKQVLEHLRLVSISVAV